MTSIKAKLPRASESNRPTTIYYQIIHNRLTRLISSSLKIQPSDWDFERGAVALKKDDPRLAQLLDIELETRRDITRLQRIISSLEDECLPYTTDDVVARHLIFRETFSLFKFMERAIERLRKEGRQRTSETYTAALSSFKKFRKGRDIMLDAIDQSLMKEYSDWLTGRGISRNTISFYMRILRAVYNLALDKEEFPDKKPFKKVYTGIGKTKKRALASETVTLIRNLDLSSAGNVEFARDMFLLSFYLRGMSLVDMAFLKKSDLSDGHITYRRRKTRQELRIEWTPEMQKIIDRYPDRSPEYLLPIIPAGSEDSLRAFRSKSWVINRNLKEVAKRAGLKINLTFYMARHSWASIAKERGVPIDIIKEGMGHESEETTRIYLAHTDPAFIDRTNQMIIKAI